ncbi:MAG: DUF4386 domain-containing protein [Solirubrobacteraceae bacterium]|nr:DUF4386 domain-containing protein [Solirubrobacteraceae bacterium]
MSIASHQRAAANARFQTALAVTGFLAVVLIFVGLLLAQYLPAPYASWSPERLDEFYDSHNDLRRLGIVMMLFGTTMFVALVSGMKVVLARIEGPPRTLATLQANIGAAGTVLLMLFAMITAVAAYRPERNPEITQALHDLGWYMAFISAVPFIIQALAIAVCVLGNKQTLLPRWFGYLNISVAVLLLPGVSMLFFHSGPLSYHGILTYWVPLFDFGIWMLAMAWAIWYASRRPDPADEALARAQRAHPLSLDDELPRPTDGRSDDARTEVPA